ncbi:MAG: DciA family protein [Neisseria sp.]|nr:DciA family protein [Neisseria sp.]
MNLDQLGKKNHHLQGLLQQSRQWQRLDTQVKQILPANLRPHFQTACIEEGCLVLLAANNMAASRLRMIAPGLLPQLQAIDSRIQTVRTKIQPKPPVAPRQNKLHMSETALVALSDSAKRLQHHPELAEALQNLVSRRKDDNTSG